MAERIAQVITILANVLVSMSNNNHDQYKRLADAMDILETVIDEYSRQ